MNDEFVFEHQEPALLERELSARLAESISGRALRATHPEEADREALRTVGTTLCETLIEYCRYRLAPKSGIDPFEDPFVGAAILTASGKLLGSHRKERRNEPHAESVAMILALGSVDNPTADALRAQIFAAYERKAWLQSPQDLEGFVASFKKAGEILRATVCEPVLLLSTLEPCKEFETQPGCAHLISAFRPDFLFYASDDTNEKGMGRSVLQKSGLSVFYNLAAKKNIEANLLFYTSVYFLGDLNRAAARAHNSFELSYCVCRLDPHNLVVDYPSDRLRIRLSTPPNIYRAPLNVRAPDAQLQSFDSNCLDKRRVLFLNHFDFGFIANYLHTYCQNTGRVPGYIICSRASEEDISEHLKALKAHGIHVYVNVLRRSDEHFIALQSIRAWQDSRPSQPTLHLIVKTESDYEVKSHGASDAASYLIDKQKARRITVYFHHLCLLEFFHLLRCLHESNAFANSLHQVSMLAVVVFPADTPKASIEDAMKSVEKRLDTQGLATRVLPSPVREEEREPEAVQRLVTSIATGTLDPLSLEPERIHALMESSNWKQRQAAGGLLKTIVAPNPDLYGDIITRHLQKQFAPDLWCKTCSVLNAVGKTERPTGQALDDLLAGMKDLGASIEEILRCPDPPECLADVVWRFVYAVCAIAESGEEVEALIGGSALRHYLGTSSFLLKELCSFACRSERSIKTALSFALSVVSMEGSTQSQQDRLRVQSRLVRLASMANTCGWEAQALLLGEVARGLAGQSTYDEETRCCEIASSGGLSAVFSSLNPQEVFRTYLFLQSSTPNARANGIAATVADELATVIAGPMSKSDSLASWRGDKTPLARLVLSEVRDTEILQYIRSMAADEDEGVRWAALGLAFDPQLRKRIVGDLNPKTSLLEKTRRTLASIIDSVLHHKPHYWLVREFLTLFCSEHKLPDTPTSIPYHARLQISDFTHAKEVFRYCPRENPASRSCGCIGALEEELCSYSPRLAASDSRRN